MHGADKAGAGNLGSVELGERIGACRVCGADLNEVWTEHPHHPGILARAISHPVPFCTYFGETDPETVEAEAIR